MSTARIEELRKKFDENPRRYFAPLANEYRKAGDFDQAIFICQEYLPQQPGHMSGHIVFGQALFEAKRLPEAKTVFETALSLDPENLIALRHLADISRDLGDTVAARAWYERVLQADPRNEEVVAIMEKLGAGAASATVDSAPTAEAPAVPTPPPAAPGPVSKPTAPVSSFAPTVVLSAAQIQEMVKARQAGKSPAEASAPPAPPPAPAPAAAADIPEVELLTLDESPTVEINAVADAVPAAPEPEVIGTATMDGLEPTSLAGTLDLPTIEPLGLETNAAPGEHAEPASAPPPLEGLDTIPLDISLPDSSPMSTTLETPAVTTPPVVAAAPPPAPEGGLLDLDASFSFGESAAPPPAAPVTASAPAPDLMELPSATETPIDGGHEDGLIDLDFDSTTGERPAVAPAAKEEVSVPTMIIDAMKSVVPAVQDAVEATVPVVMDAMESAAPAMMDFVDTTIPSVVEAVQATVPAVVEAVVETPTIVMEAIKVPTREAAPPEPPAAPPPPTPASSEPRISQSVPFVTETMAQLYLSQGHRAEAIDIYRKLIEARPNDAELKGRLAIIEAEARPSGAQRALAAVPPRFTGTGPSIRTVLRELFGLDGSTTFATSTAAASVPAELGSIDALFSTESAGDGLGALAVAFDGGYVASRGTIDGLFASGSQ